MITQEKFDRLVKKVEKGLEEQEAALKIEKNAVEPQTDYYEGTVDILSWVTNMIEGMDKD